MIEFMMKKIFSIVVLSLLLNSTSFSDEKNFDIEGFKLGDSLLNTYTEELLQKNKQDFWKSKRVSPIEFFPPQEASSTYDSLQFMFKTKDKERKIIGISADRYYKENIEDCFAEKDRLVIEMTNNLSDVKKISKSKTRKHGGDKTGNSSVTDVSFKFKSKAVIVVACYNWSEKITKEKEWYDQLRISLRDKSYVSFLNNAY
jgi:hypothetical protein